MNKPLLIFFLLIILLLPISSSNSLLQDSSIQVSKSSIESDIDFKLTEVAKGTFKVNWNWKSEGDIILIKNKLSNCLKVSVSSTCYSNLEQDINNIPLQKTREVIVYDEIAKINKTELQTYINPIYLNPKNVEFCKVTVVNEYTCEYDLNISKNHAICIQMQRYNDTHCEYSLEDPFIMHEPNCIIEEKERIINLFEIDFDYFDKNTVYWKTYYYNSTCDLIELKKEIPEYIKNLSNMPVRNSKLLMNKNFDFSKDSGEFYFNVPYSSLFGEYTVIGDLFDLGFGTAGFTLNDPQNNIYTNNNTPSFNFLLQGNYSRYNVELFINNTSYGIIGALNNTASVITVNKSLSNGLYTWFLNATNITTDQSAVRNITVDTTVPTVNVYSPVNTSWYNSSSVVVNVSSSEEGTGFIVPNLDDSLVSWWRMDDLNSSGDVVDYMGRNNGTVTNATQTSAGKFGKGFSFDGDGDTILLTEPPASSTNIYNGTLSAWIKTSNAGSGWRGIVVKQSAYGMFLYSNILSAYDWSTSTPLYSGANLADNKWHHVAITFKSGITNGTIFYFDGNQNLSTNITIYGHDQGVVIASGGNPANTQDFNGTIDEVMIFNRSLSATEIMSLYNATKTQFTQTGLIDGTHTYKSYTSDLAGNIGQSGLFGFGTDTVYPSVNFTSPTPSNNSLQSNTYVYVNVSATDSANNVSSFIDFDNSLVLWMRGDDSNQSTGTYGAKFYDGSIYGNNGTSYGNAMQTAAGKLGKGMTFDGDGDFVNVSDNDNLDFDANDFSCSLWFKTGASNSYKNILRKGYYNSVNYKGFDILFETDASNMMYGRVSNSSSQFEAVYVTGMTPRDNTWHNIVFTKGTYLKIYYDGVLNSTGTTNVSNWNITNALSLYIGGEIIGFDFNGTIDDVMIFNRSLSAEEIKGLYANSSSKYFANNFTALSDGNHSFKAYVQDLAGNVNDTGTRMVTVDTTVPTVNVYSPVNNSYYNSSSVLVNVSSSEEGSGFIVPNLDNSLVSWWRMDDLNSSGDVVDYMGRSNALSGAHAQQVSSGKFGKGFVLDGVDDDLNAGSYVGTNSATLCMWIKPVNKTREGASYNSPGGITGNSGRAALTFLIYSDTDTMYFYINTSIYTAISDPTDVIYGQWHHYCGYYNGTGFALFRNGNFVVSGAETGTIENGTFYVGSWQGNYYNGTIDEVMLFNRSLSSSEIMSLYNATKTQFTQTGLTDGTHTYKAYSSDLAGNIGQSGVYGFGTDTVYPSVNFTAPTASNNSLQSSTFVYVNVSATDSNNVSAFIDFDNSLVSWWRMDDVSGSTVYDYMGRNSGTATGAVQTSAGKFGKGFRFDGDGDYIAHNHIINGTQFTICSWAYKRGYTEFQSIASDYGEFADPYILATEYSEGNIRFYVGNGSSIDYIDHSGFTAEVWHHVCGVFNGGTDELSIYLDTVNQSKTTYIEFTDPTKSGTGSIGRWYSYYFNGTIDDVMILNRSLSSAEISALYANSSTKYFANNFTGLSDGTHTFKAYVQDLAGNVNNTGTRTVTVDTNLCHYYPSYGNWNVNQYCEYNTSFNIYGNLSVFSNGTINCTNSIACIVNMTSQNYWVWTESTVNFMDKLVGKWMFQW